MVYTEIKERNGRKYCYRVKNLRNGKKFKKNRIYLGVNLSKNELKAKEKIADKKLDILKKGLDKNSKIVRQIRDILKKNKIRKAGIFGSYARGDQRKDSDIDILIEPAKNMGFEFAGLEIQLSETLKRKVDLVSYNGISPYLRERILAQEVRII